MLFHTERLTLEDNQLTDDVPLSLCEHFGKKETFLSSDCDPGALFQINCDCCDKCYGPLTGLIPTQLGDVKQLERLSLSYNQLRGSVSEDFLKLQNTQMKINQFPRHLLTPKQSAASNLFPLKVVT